jgi:hypothetical protein
MDAVESDYVCASIGETKNKRIRVLTSEILKCAIIIIIIGIQMIVLSGVDNFSNNSQKMTLSSSLYALSHNYGTIRYCKYPPMYTTILLSTRLTILKKG